MQFEALATEKKLNPNKMYYKIGEVAELLDVKTSVLRFWEHEFHIKTQKTSTNQRIYDKKGISKLITIKELLYKQGFTLAGAKKQLEGNHREEKKAEEPTIAFKLSHEKVTKELDSLKENTRRHLLHLRRELQTIVECLEE
jgi:DNA-binding transcriptional MerR regulator